MSREEKVNILKAIIQECEDYQWQRKETLFEIIKDLEQEPFINKPCVSENVCEHDKQMVLDKIKAEIEQVAFKDVNGWKYIFVNRVNQIFDKYKAEGSDKE